MTKIYLSHPYGWSEKNRAAAKDVAALYRWAWAGERGKEDYRLINPLEILEPWAGRMSEDEILRDAVELMRGCEAVIFCPGWKRSRGCRLEHYIAGREGIQRVYLPEYVEDVARELAMSERVEKRRAAEAVSVA